MIDEIRLQRARNMLRKALREHPTTRTNLSMVLERMGTPTRDRQASFKQRMRERGHKQITVWLSGKSLALIDDTMKAHGITRNEAVEMLIQRGESRQPSTGD